MDTIGIEQILLCMEEDEWTIFGSKKQQQQQQQQQHQNCNSHSNIKDNKYVDNEQVKGTTKLQQTIPPSLLALWNLNNIDNACLWKTDSNSLIDYDIVDQLLHFEDNNNDKIDVMIDRLLLWIDDDVYDNYNDNIMNHHHVEFIMSDIELPCSDRNINNDNLMWDIISDVTSIASVMEESSLRNNISTYRNVLLRNDEIIMNQISLNNINHDNMTSHIIPNDSVDSKKQHLDCIIEEKDEFNNDNDDNILQYIMDGVKCAKGGKVLFKYRGNINKKLQQQQMNDNNITLHDTTKRQQHSSRRRHNNEHRRRVSRRLLHGTSHKIPRDNDAIL